MPLVVLLGEEHADQAKDRARFVSLEPGMQRVLFEKDWLCRRF